ncbi:hypothetical protein [Priestia aryabhattai]
MLVSIKRNAIILLSAFSLLIVAMFTYPAAAVKAEEKTVTSSEADETEDLLNNVTDEDIQKAKDFIENALILDENSKYSIDESVASDIGYSKEEIKNLKDFFTSLTPKEAEFLDEKSQEKVNEDSVESFHTMSIALPSSFVMITVTELVAILTAAGLAGVAQQFLKDVYNSGVRSACRKFAKKSTIIKNFCKDNKYPVK